MTHRWAWIDEYITHHQILRTATALRNRPSPQQASLGTVLRVRGLAVAGMLCGLALVLLAVLAAFAGPLTGGDVVPLIGVLGVGTFNLTFGCWMCFRARAVADRATARKLQRRVPGILILQPPHASTPSPASDPEEAPPPPLPADLI